MDSKVKTVCQLNQCAGCMSCVDSCPKKAITIHTDLMKYNAVINMDLCVDCNLCHTICPQNNPPKPAAPKYWYQGWANDDEIRKNSASGGFASAIAKKFIEDGGEVYGCCYEQGEFVFRCADNVEDLKKFAGSKYVKSNPRGCYREIKQKLSDDKKILFIGLPCQVAAIRNYTRDKFDSLYTVDLICHGTPSPMLLENFLQQYGYSLKTIKDIRFRNKNRFQLKEGYKGIITNGVSDRYIIAFLNSLNYTENCYQCKYARRERVSDITVGDSWGSDLGDSEIQKGLSLALCTSNKGHALLKEANLHLKDVDLDKAIERNGQLEHSSEKPNGYDNFCHGIESGKKFNSLVTKNLRKPCFRQDVKEILIKMKIIRGGGQSGIAVLPYESSKNY